jgi:hypothetical protein
VKKGCLFCIHSASVHESPEAEKVTSNGDQCLRVANVVINGALQLVADGAVERRARSKDDGYKVAVSISETGETSSSCTHEQQSEL